MKTAKANNIGKVLRNFADWVEKEDFEIRAEVAADVNVLLDDILADDGFGTEGQNDPRGDQRP